MKFTKLILKKGGKTFDVDVDELDYDVSSYENEECMGEERLYRVTGHHPKTREMFVIEFTEYPINALDSGPTVTGGDFKIVDYDIEPEI